jgi:hypothetical protein
MPGRRGRAGASAAGCARWTTGHPGPGSPLPNPVGLIRSDEGGATWESVSLAGQIDFHALALTDDYIVGFDGVTGLVTSTDRGATWQQGAPMAAVSLAAVGDEVWATTPRRGHTQHRPHHRLRPQPVVPAHSHGLTPGLLQPTRRMRARPSPVPVIPGLACWGCGDDALWIESHLEPADGSG